MTAQARRGIWALAAVVIVGALVRFTTLAQQSLWFDEALTWNFAANGLGAGLAALPDSELTPPLYFVLVWMWTHVFGLGEVGLRSFSALCGTAVIPVVWGIGRELVSERAGLMAAVLIAVNPLMFWYAQEARSYALLTLMTTLSLLALARAMKTPTRRRIVLWSIVCSLALCTHYFSIFVVAPEVLVFLAMLRAERKLSWPRLLLGLGPIFATALVVAPLALHQSQADASFIGRSGSLSSRLVLLVKEDFFGYGGPIADGALLVIIASLLVLIALIIARASRRERFAASLLLAVGGFGVVAASLLAIGGADYFSTRNLLTTSPLLVLIVAIGLSTIQGGGIGELGVASLAMISIMCIATVVANDGYHRADWRGAARTLGPADAPRAIVSYDRAVQSLKPYVDRLMWFPAVGRGVREIDVVSLREPWLGTDQRPLRVAAPPPGFELVQRVARTTYVVVRYRARTSRTVRPAALHALYPDLRRRHLLLQLPSAGS